MKKLLVPFFILFSVGALSAQNLNFKDTTALKTLLCSHTWIRYYVNPDSSFSDRVMDSIKFYPNKTFYESARPKDDNENFALPSYIKTGTWVLGSTGKASRGDTSTDCISVNLKCVRDNSHMVLSSFSIVDGHRISNSKLGKILMISAAPFLGNIGEHEAMSLDIHAIWQAPRQFKQPKKYPH